MVISELLRLVLGSSWNMLGKQYARPLSLAAMSTEYTSPLEKKKLFSKTLTLNLWLPPSTTHSLSQVFSAVVLLTMVWDQIIFCCV